MPAQTSRLPRRDRRSRNQRLRKVQNMTNHQEAFDGDRLLAETDWLAANLDAPDLRILDCTVFLAPDPAGGTRAESGHAKWQEAHIPGSAFADVLGALSDPDAEYRCTLPRADRFAEAMSALGVGEGTRVVLYCVEGPAYAPAYGGCCVHLASIVQPFSTVDLPSGRRKGGR